MICGYLAADGITTYCRFEPVAAIGAVIIFAFMYFMTKAISDVASKG